MRTVNNDPGISCPNANWNGTSTNYCTNVTGDDTVAHEWGHAYTDYTSNLIYAWQSGAMNESYSDIWGEVVDLLNGRGTDTPGGLRASDGSACSIYGNGAPSTDDTYRWLSGEDDPAFGGSIRDMWRPECYNDPGKVTSASYTCSTGDGGGVHTNSGVPNHAFALLTDGGTYNGQTVTGLGLTKASHIFWQAQSVYLGAGSNFIDLADALEASCTDLTGVNLNALSTSSTAQVPSGQIITAGDCVELADTIAATELRTPPTQCGFTAPFTTAPALCEGQGNGTPVSIDSQDWEGGVGGWTVGTHDIANPASFDNPDWTVVGSLPSMRSGSAMYVEDSINRGACTPANTVAGALNLDSPPIVIPAGAAVPRVAFDHYVSVELGWDGGNLKVSVNGGPFTVVPNSAYEVNGYFAPGVINGGGNDNPLGGQPGFTGGGQGQTATGWGQSQVNLTGIASPGDSVVFRWDMGLDGCFGWDGWYVDEVEVYYCQDEGAGGQCGNSVLDPGEQCDDGNTSNGDGCSDTCQVEDGWVCTDPTPGGNAVADPGFEAGTPNPSWTEASTNFGTPLCDAGACGVGGGTGPHSGDWWSWFGGISGVVETGSVSQNVTIPVGSNDLTFWLEVPVADSTGSMDAKVDGNTVFTVDESGIGSYSTYTQITADISAYADGGSHTLSFEFDDRRRRRAVELLRGRRRDRRRRSDAQRLHAHGRRRHGDLLQQPDGAAADPRQWPLSATTW